MPERLAGQGQGQGRSAKARVFATTQSSRVRAQLSATEHLVEVAQRLSMVRDLDGIMAIVRRAARELTGADGATFVLRDGDLCFYADEDAIAPLWKGHRFAMSTCISGWAMLNKQAAVIEDIYRDPRIPHDAYRPTFVRSLAMVPIRTSAPVGAIGNYWAERHRPTDGEVKLLRALADFTSVAMENVRLYGELEKRMFEAQDAIGIRDEFITVAAHELRTPLTALQLQLKSVEIMAARAEPSCDDRLTDRIARAVAGARRLGTLVNDLLDGSQVAHRSIPLTVEDMDLAHAAHAAAERVAAAAERAGCTLEVKASSVRGRWDRLRLERVISHLLSNAIKYGPGKPVALTVEAKQAIACIAVCDQGVGISPDSAGRIFERFGRVGSVTSYGGLGLGLYLARQTVEAHGGTIRYESPPAAGCTFVIELPIA